MSDDEPVEANEEATIDEIVKLNLATLDRSQERVPRGQHPKHHGCVTAKFIVEVAGPQLEANWSELKINLRELEEGVFKERGKTYDALIRFSNGRQKDDQEADAHGMAIKLLGVDGTKLLEGHENETTQDFVLVDNEVFFLKNISEYADFNRLTAESKADSDSELEFIAKLIFRHPIIAFRLRRFISKKPASPFASNYWSTTPYRLGSRTVKYMARAVPPSEDDETGVDSPDGLSKALVSHLAHREARFDFGVHLQTDPDDHPVDNATSNWSDNGAPFVKLATIIIPPQPVEPQSDLAENLVFSPWHTLPEHEPLGAINRARRDVYAAMSKERHRENDISPAGSSEPPRT